MKSKKIIIYFIVLTIWATCGFGEVTNLSNFPRTGSNHPWVLAYDGKVMVVWREEGGYSGGERNIYYTVHNGSSWSKPTAAFNTSVFSKNPHITRGPDGTIHMAWADGNARASREVFHATYKNDSWGDRSQIYDSPNNSNWPRVGVMSGNVLNVLWTSEIGSSNEHYIIRNSWKSGGSWDPSGKVVSTNSKWTGETSLATHNDMVCQDDKAFAVWQQGTSTSKNIWFAEKVGSGNWTTPKDISGGNFSSYPAIAVDSKGNLHVIASGLRGRVWGTSRIDGRWTDISPINDGDHERGFVDIDVDDGDRLHAVYAVGTHVYYNSGNNLGAWGEEQQVWDKDGAHFPALSADDSGNVHIAWCTGDEGEDGDIMYAKIGAGSVPDTHAPVARFKYSPEYGKPPLKVSFDASQSYDVDGTIVGYRWEFGEGQKVEAVTAEHTYTKRGVYTVTLSVKDNDGLVGSAQDTVYVSDPPTANFTMTPTTAVAPATIHFDASASRDPDGNIVKYLWYFDDGQTGSGRQISHTFYEPGDYNVALEVFDNYGISTMETKTLVVHSVYPPAAISYEFKTNRNLFSIEYFFDVTWQQNPQNIQNGVNVVHYSVYRRRIGDYYYTLLTTVNGDRFYYWDRGLAEDDADRYEYTVTAIDDKGNESLLDLAGRRPGRGPQKTPPGKDK